MEKIYEINDPYSLAKLSGLQLSITKLEEMAIAVRNSIPEKRGIINGCVALAKRVRDETRQINYLVEKEKIEVEEAKIRVDQTLKNANIIDEIAAINRTDLKSMEAKIVAHKEAAETLAKKYKELAVKYETDERIAKEESKEEPKEEPKEESKEEPKEEPKLKPAKRRGRPRIKAPKGKKLEDKINASNS